MASFTAVFHPTANSLAGVLHATHAGFSCAFEARDLSPRFDLSEVQETSASYSYSHVCALVFLGI